MRYRSCQNRIIAPKRKKCKSETAADSGIGLHFGAFCRFCRGGDAPDLTRPGRRGKMAHGKNAARRRDGMKKISAWVLALALAAALLGGCASTDPQARESTAPTAAPAPAATPVPTAPAAPDETTDPTAPSASIETAAPAVGRLIPGRFFQDVWRGDVAYGEMEYEHYLLSWFDEYTDPIYRLAEEGGSRRRLEDALYDLEDELYYIATLNNLIQIEYDRNPADEDVAAECLYIQEVYNSADDAFWRAMHALALSGSGALLENWYADWQIQWFREYDDAGDLDWAVYSRESALEQEYYRLMAADAPDYDAAARVFAELVGVRQEIARLNGYDSYVDYAYDALYARGYTPAESRRLWECVKTYFVPLLETYADKVSRASDRLYFSDAIDCSSQAVLAALGDCLSRFSPELRAAYDYMLAYGLYDIDPSPEKVDTGYTLDLSYFNEPFLFNAARGTYYDYTDTFHEFGHFANYFYTRSDLIFGVGDNDLAELQSQGLEALMTFFYDDIFGTENGDLICRDVLLNMIYSVVDGALYDEFQQQVYALEAPTAEAVREIYRRVYESYGYVPYPGCEDEWIDVVHNFSYPLYYISYSVSAVGALELFSIAREDFQRAGEIYLTVEAMDCELYYYDEALAEAGLGDIFDEATYREIAGALDRCLGA